MDNKQKTSFSKNLFKHSFIYSLSSIIFKATNFLLLPIYTRVLTAEEFGTLALLGTFFGLFRTISFLGAQTGVLRTCLNQKEGEKRRLVISTAQWSLILIVGIISLPPIYFALPITRAIGIEEKYAILVAFLFFNNFLRIIKYVRDIHFRINEYSKRTLFYNNIENLLDISFSILLVLFLKTGVFGFTYAQVASLFLISILFIPWFLKNLVNGFSVFYFKDIFSYGINFVLVNITSWILNLSDRWILNLYWGTAVVGIYSIGYRFSSILQILNDGLKTQWGKSLYEMGSDDNIAKYLNLTLTRYLIISSTILAFITLYIKEILFILTPIKFHEAHLIVPIVSLAYMVMGIGTIFSAVLHLQRKAKSFWVISSFAAVLNIILNFIFIPKYGMFAASITTAIAFSTQPICYFWISKKYYNINLPFSKMLLLIISLAILYIFSILLSNEVFILSLLIKTILFSVFLLFIFISKIISDSDRISLINILKRTFNKKD